MPRVDAVETPVTANARTGSRLPLSSRPPRSVNANARAARAVRSETSTSPDSAAACSRAATLTTSPVTIASPGAASSAARTEPVLTPTRTASSTPWVRASRAFTWSRRRSIASPALTARSGSSSCATGTPNTAITASPMNFSTRPPSASASARIASK